MDCDQNSICICNLISRITPNCFWPGGTRDFIFLRPSLLQQPAAPGFKPWILGVHKVAYLAWGFSFVFRRKVRTCDRSMSSGWGPWEVLPMSDGVGRRLPPRSPHPWRGVGLATKEIIWSFSCLVVSHHWDRCWMGKEHSSWGCCCPRGGGKASLCMSMCVWMVLHHRLNGKRWRRGWALPPSWSAPKQWHQLEM